MEDVRFLDYVFFVWKDDAEGVGGCSRRGIMGYSLIFKSLFV